MTDLAVRPARAVTCGTDSGYQSGCHCGRCRAAHTLSVKKYRVRRARNHGPLLVPADGTARLIGEARRAGWTWRRIAAATGIDKRWLHQIVTGGTRWVQPSTHARIAAVAADWAPLPVDARLWPTAPLKAALVSRYGSLSAIGDESQRRHLLRAATIRSDTAETYAAAHQWMAFEIWPDWYEGGEEAAAG